MPQKKWSDAQLLNRYHLLQRDGFTNEEAWDIASWSQNLTHWVIRGMRRDRRRLVANWKSQGMRQDEIDSRSERRYIDLGIPGLYEDEEWYVSRVPASE